MPHKSNKRTLHCHKTQVRSDAVLSQFSKMCIIVAAMTKETSFNSAITECLPFALRLQHRSRAGKANFSRFRSQRERRQKGGSMCSFGGFLGGRPRQRFLYSPQTNIASVLFPELLSLLVSPSSTRSTEVFTIFVSLVALLSALYVILSNKYPPKVEQWAYATVAMILGFWLRT